MTAPPIRVLVAVDRLIDAHTVEIVVDDPGIQVVNVIDQEAGRAAVDGIDADVVLIACGAASPTTLAFVHEITQGHDSRPVVVACEGRPNGLVRDVLTSGADDIIVIDDHTTPGPETYFAMQKALARRATAPVHDGSEGRLICVLGPKGGIGKTLTATNLGVALADAGHRTVIVDLDLQFGDLGLALGLKPERTIFDLATAGGVLDGEKIDGFLAEHSCGAKVLLAPVRPDQAGSITVEFLTQLYGMLVDVFDYVVVDTPPGFTPEVIATIDAAAWVCMVGMLDAPSLKNTKLGLETLQLMNYSVDRVRVVLNRADTAVGITHADVVAVLGRAPDVLVPSQREVVRSINAGEPIVLGSRRSEPAKAFRALADLFVVDGQRWARGGRRRLLRKAA
jgi:pilus assembly protein CpaE